MFENIEEARNILRTRTSKIIGGYVTENLFIEKYKKVFPDREYSQGWWGGIENSENKTLTFFVVKNTLNDLDKKVIEKLESKDLLWKQLLHENDIWFVVDNNSKLSLSDYIASRRLKLPDYKEKNIQMTNDPYIDRCIETYEQQGIIRKIASSIYIEDLFLNKYYTISNIDLIGEDKEGVPVYIEIKFKNEFEINNKLVFGIDTFQYDNLFTSFINCGMKVENIVLYNDIKHKRNISSTVIFDFLDKKENQELIWKYKEIFSNMTIEKYSFSSGKTGWKSNNKRTVYCIPLKEYRDFEHYTLPSKYISIFPEGGWGKCVKCNENIVIKNGKNGKEFMGCLGYKNHNSLL